VPVRTTVAQPLKGVVFSGYRDVHCTERGTDPNVGAATGTDFTGLSALLQAGQQAGQLDGGLAAGTLMQGGGELRFRERLIERLGTLDLRAAQSALDAAEKSTDRAAQFQHLFGVPLPPLTRSFTSDNIFGGVAVVLDASMEEQLLTGGQVTVAIALDCLKPAEIDTAIAEAKRVYAAVIAAMRTGPKGAQ
jgi:hypothetical protein